MNNKTDKKLLFEYCKREDVFEGNDQIVNTIKVVVYKQFPHLFELLDFDNDEIFKEPLIYAFYYLKDSKVSMEQILYGYIEDEKKPGCISVWSDEDGIIYLPNIGWLITEEKCKSLTVSINSEKSYVLNIEERPISYTFEPLKLIKNTSFELVSRQHPLLKVHYYDSNNRFVDVEIDKVSRKNSIHMEDAFSIIKAYIPAFYELLEITIKKVVIFNDPSVRRNSFAAQTVHGCVFFNAFQDNYNEVFFIEDIAHQCGHVIFNALSVDKTAIFKLSPDTKVRSNNLIGWIMSRIESRTLFILFHALYTYYLIVICLDACLENNVFSGIKKHETLGRLASTLVKFKMDLRIIGEKDDNGISLYLTEKGVNISNMFLEKQIEMEEKWGSYIKHYRLFNQPYNFSYSHFFKANPISKDEAI